VLRALISGEPIADTIASRLAIASMVALDAG